MTRIAAAWVGATLILGIADSHFARSGLAAAARHSDIAYVEGGHRHQALDLYTPMPHRTRSAPVIFWIHGGGWQRGDKADVACKPQALTERGFVFVSTNYRLLPKVTMEQLVGDVAAALGWVHRHVGKHGGDPTRIIVAGHSAGGQLAALLCTDDRYLAKEGVPFASLAGCVPVDGDTYDIPKIILTTEQRRALYGLPMPTFGHRQKFGNDPQKHVLFSAVAHVGRGKGIPPFLILHAGNPDTQAQAHRLADVLQAAGVRARAIGYSNKTHRSLNDDLGLPGDTATEDLFGFLNDVGMSTTARPE